MFWQAEMTNVTISAGVTYLGDGAFLGCVVVETITFTGDAPIFGNTYNSLFSPVTAIAYYPAGNQTWTEDVMQDYGGDTYELAADEPVQGGEDTQLGGETEGETGGETSGSTSGFTVESPKTGDESNVILFVTLLAAALASLTRLCPLRQEAESLNLKKPCLTMPE